MPKFKIPKTLGACADLLYELRKTQLEAQKAVDTIAEQEQAVKNYIIDELPKSQLSGASGKIATVKVEQAEKPTINDFEAFMKYVAKTKSWDLVQQRCNDKAIQERLDAGKTVAGIKLFKFKKVSITKRS